MYSDLSIKPSPSPLCASRYIVASRFRCYPCEYGYIVRGLRTVPLPPRSYLVGYVRWCARSDSVLLPSFRQSFQQLSVRTPVSLPRSPTSRAALKSHLRHFRASCLAGKCKPVYSCGHCCAGNFFSTMTPPGRSSECSRFKSPARAACNCLEVILCDNKAMGCLEASCPPATALAYQE